ncbi:MAG TPA: HlyD family efflux transporter periplasmic adaptor subunit [Candidatus Omnitrophota bacterium]|nr:HlyD family efflux transporter periplasmic adaptor subunit [Candidatus Omnitrophota bacterium]
MTSETNEHISSEEPKLFEEKPEKKEIGRILLIIGAVAIAAFLLWPRGIVEGEAVLQARRFAKMGLTSSGVLKELLHEKGEFVKAGEIIAKFENSELLKRYAQAQLLLEKLNENKAALQEKSGFYEKEKARKQILQENSVIGVDLLEKAKLDAANVARELVMLGKEIQSTEKETEYLKSRVETLELKAPFDGTLLTDPSDTVGSPVKEGEFVLEIADPGTYFLEFLVLETDIEGISVGNKATARFRAFPWKTYSGEVTRIASRTTEEIEKVFKVKHVIPCEIRLHETPRDLKYGMRAHIKIQSKRKGVL